MVIRTDINFVALVATSQLMGHFIDIRAATDNVISLVGSSIFARVPLMPSVLT